MESLLNIQNLAIGYDEVPLVRDINMIVRQGDYIGIIGPNGGGKTTFVKTLTGALKPLSGRIDQVGGLSIGYLPQIKSMDKDFPLSVIDVVLSGLLSTKGLFGRYGKADRAKALRLLRETGIEQLADRTIGELSGGELQRVLLCRALIADPRLLILDEPTTFVDHKFEKEFYALLHELNSRMAILMVSHDLGTISSRVKSIVCINRCFHYHPSNILTTEDLQAYDCPIQLISHGPVPHTILKNHEGCACASHRHSEQP